MVPSPPAARAALPAPPGVARCFVALRPDDAARAALGELALRLARALPRARPVDAENLHLTLAFLGALDLQKAPVIAAALRALPALHGSWQLDRIGAFARGRVLWASGPAEPALERLAAQVRAALDAQGVAYDRRAFVPHVTLARGQAPAGATLLDPPMAWPLGAPELLVSARDAARRLHYRPWAPSASP
jgi:2'-5' RNA ligase